MNNTNKPRITLATLPQATPQEVADQIVQHLLRQGRKSRQIGSACLYRGPDGLRCAAGALIDDREYCPTMENGSWDTLVAQGKAPAVHEALIHDFQMAHDGADAATWKDSNVIWDADEWPEMLAAVCYAHGLEFNPPAGWVDPREVTA